MSFVDFVVDVESEKFCTNRSSGIMTSESCERVPVMKKYAGISFPVYLDKPFPVDIQSHENELFDVTSTAG